ncbi:MAG: HAMP domain-containing sensor histidine kinase [Actinomycetota bacterium]
MRSSFLRRYNWELCWGLWALANLLWMKGNQDWISIPFHFIWVGFTVLYGFRAWSNRLTWVLAGAVAVSTGLVLTDAWADGSMPADEVYEVPLMFGMFLAMMLHTTWRRAAIAQLEKLSEENAQILERERLFVQNAAHALRSPITVALAHAEMLQITADDPSVRGDAGVVVDEINRLRRLADRLLLLVTVGAPTALNVEPTELGHLIDDAVRRWSPVPRRWNVNRRDNVTVLADPERLTLALDTLIENAVKATGEGGAIDLSVRREHGDAVVEISDDGPGIPPEMLDSIFERFTHGADHGSSTSGFGLGLSIVRPIVEMHGGTATARNREGGGAVFELRLKRSDERRERNELAVAHSLS